AGVLVVAGVAALRHAPLRVDDEWRPGPPMQASVVTAPPSTARPIAGEGDGTQPANLVDTTRTAGVAFASGDFERARTLYEDALAAHPDDAATLNALGQTLVRLDRVPEAIERFERAV